MGNEGWGKRQEFGRVGRPDPRWVARRSKWWVRRTHPKCFKMSKLKINEKQILETLLQMSGGYVLNFSDRTIEEFFRDNLQIDFYSKKYNYGSGSKANRMRGFWIAASDSLAAKSIRELLDYIDNQILLGLLEENDFPKPLVEKARKIANALDGKATPQKTGEKVPTENEFIKREFENLTLEKLGLDGPIETVIKERIQEIKKCLNAKAPLSVVFLCGSTLEGILLATASNYPKEFNQALSAPKKDGKVLPFHDWKLFSLIDVGREVGIIGEDVKKYGHALRDFRNYIHPFAQLSSSFSPHEHTAKISWQVLQAAIFEITEYRLNRSGS